MSTKEQATKLTLRVDLKGKALERFIVLKEKYGLENDTELIRLLISMEYERVFIKASD